MIEIINIKKETFENIVSKFLNFKERVLSLCEQHQNKQLDDWLDNQDVCIMLNISPRTLQYYRAIGKISFSRLNNKIYYKIDDVEKLLTKKNDL